MLVLLTRVLLWASVGLLIWYVLARVIPKKYLTWFGGVILIFLLVLSFLEPDDGTVQIIWRIISFPLTPLGAAIVLLGFSLSDGINKIRGMPAAIALGILLISSIPVSAQYLVSGAEQSIRQAYNQQREFCGDVCRTEDLPNGGDVGAAGTIVVFGEQNEVSRAINLSNIADADAATYSDLTPRLDYAAELYAISRSRGGAPFVQVTAGENQEEDEESVQNDIIRTVLERNGVRPEDIRLLTTGLDIQTTARRVDTFLQDRQLIASREQRSQQGATRDDPRVVLVAPAILMSRAALTFEKNDLEVIARPTNFYSIPLQSDDDLLRQLPNILPSVDALQLTTRYWNELLSSLYYFLRGWLPNFTFGWDSNIEI